MPRLDGFGLLQELRKDVELRSVPVIVLSARAERKPRSRACERVQMTIWSNRSAPANCMARVAANVELSRTRAQSARLLREEAQIAQNNTDCTYYRMEGRREIATESALSKTAVGQRWLSTGANGPRPRPRWAWRLGMQVVVGSGRVRAISPAWTEILGHHPSEVVGKSFLEFVWPEDAEPRKPVWMPQPQRLI